MGMFDSVIIRCDRCNSDIEFQSKAGDCMCRTYSIHNCPTRIKGDLDGEIGTCGNCGNTVEIETQCIMVVR